MRDGGGSSGLPGSAGSGRAFALRAFSSTVEVMEAASACRSSGITCRLMPRPAFIEGAGCGTVLRSAPEDEERVEEALRSAGLVPTARVEAEGPAL